MISNEIIKDWLFSSCLTPPRTISIMLAPTIEASEARDFANGLEVLLFGKRRVDAAKEAILFVEKAGIGDYPNLIY